MDEKELKELLEAQFKSFKETLPKFIDEGGMKKAFEDFKTDITKEFGDSVKKSDFDELKTAMTTQGEIITSLKLKTGSENQQTFKDLLIANKSELETMAKENGAGRIEIKTTVKAVISTNVTSDTNAFRETMVGQIKRGVAYLRNLLQVVQLGTNSHGTVKWYEQLAVTNNATNVDETRVAGTTSNLTWVEKNITGKRIFDWLKIGVDQLKDVDFVLGEVQRLIERNMRLKENDQLLNGTGIGNEIAGLLTYAKEFVTTGISIPEANLVDLCGKIHTQIDTDLLGAAMPNYVIANRNDTDKVRFAKTSIGGYVFPQWTMGDGLTNIGSMQVVENPLVEENTLLSGDFSLATLYVWDDLVIEIAQIEDDKKTGMTTIMAYMRENLRVQDVDKNAFVKVSDVDASIDAISVHSNG